jgi:hypothetical protein
MRKVIILGSSARDGHTKKAVDTFISLTDCDVLDLNDFNISYYDYEHQNENDDYLNLIKRIISN